MQVVVRYHEIALKGRNRPFFVDKLARNLRRATADLAGVTVQCVAGRIGLRAGDDVPWATLRARLDSVFGIANYSRVQEVAVHPDLRALEAAAVDALTGRTAASFCVRVRRSDKSFPLNSVQIERQLGAAIHMATGLPANMTQPELTVRVELLRDRAYLACEKLPGAGGLAVGSSGRVLALLSGGIDSPVAAWRLMRRGCTVMLVNFHAFPLQDRTMLDKVQALARSLTRFQFQTRLYLVPFAPVQQTIVARCPAALRVVLYRRFMLRIAEALARRRDAKALVTGDSLGQVASQTLDNLSAIDEVARLPVLRPLIGMDKDEITQQAQRIGTFETSTLPDQDCCQLFVPKSPATAAQLDEVRAAEAELDIAGLVQQALTGLECLRFRFPEGLPGEPETPATAATAAPARQRYLPPVEGA
jgi:thiamine biosynthesis protein ThiI